MRRAVYQVLLKAPFKIAGSVAGVAGFLGSVFSNEVKTVLNSGAFPVQTVSVILLAGAAIYFALLWLLKPGESGNGGGAGTTITTGGPNSPGIGSIAGDFHQHNYAAPAATQERKSPYGSARDVKYIDAGAYDVIRRSLTPIELRPTPRQKCPEVAVWWAIHRIAARIGEGAGGFPEARRQLRQAALEGRVVLWGQEQIDPIEMHDFDRHSEAWSPINQTYWNNYRLNESAAHRDQQDAAHTEDERQPTAMLGRYWNLKVDKREINRCWPKPPETTNDGRP